jgi:hypothetical protein
MWIRDLGWKNSDPGSEREKSRIRDKHPGSATLPSCRKGYYRVQLHVKHLLFMNLEICPRRTFGLGYVLLRIRIHTLDCCAQPYCFFFCHLVIVIRFVVSCYSFCLTIY